MIFKAPSRRHQFGVIAATCLVALRMAVGWHFFGDGVKKLDPNFRSAYFLQQAKGPFAERFLDLIPDRFGMDRLDRNKVLGQWEKFRGEATRELGFDEQQNDRADELLKKYQDRLNAYFASDGADIRQHRLEVRRLEDARKQPAAEVAFQADWISQRDLELQAAAKPWIAKVDALQTRYEDEVLAIAKDKKAARKLSRIADPMAKSWVDHSVTWVTILVGVCLLLGFLVRPAAIVGAIFLCSVLLTQPFWAHGANLMMFPYQLVEICALLFLAAVAAGRYAGLDFIWWAIRHRNYVVD